MNNFESRLTGLSPYVLGILRIVTALLFLAHGTSKLFGFPSTGTQPALMSIGGLAGVIEVVGSILLVLGLYSRQAAFILSGEMAVAYFTAHLPHGFYPLLNHGESAVLFCFIFFYIVFAGPGAFSLDARRRPALTPAYSGT